MQVQYVYVKKRSQFGKCCYFTDKDNIEVDIKSDPSLVSQYIRVDPFSRGTLCTKVFAAHEVNTTTATYKNTGILHIEGGWPKDINKNDQEQTLRYRRKIEKDDIYVHTMQQLLPPMEHYVLQNNACNIYEQYFQDTEPTQLTQRTFCRTVNVYRDPLPSKRPVTHISWSPDQGSRIAVSHCHVAFKKLTNFSPISYIWDVANPNKPFCNLSPFCPILALEYNPKESNILVSGMMTGQVGLWDIRRSFQPVDLSLVENSHRDPCNKVLWINSKTGTEFFSSSKDGQIKWWDTRKLRAPVETLVMDLEKPDNQDLDRAVGISTLEFEASIGTRFMVGLENGTVISGNRKGKLPTEKLATRFVDAQYGPVISCERNPNFVKNFLTVGDWTARVWSEDCRESSIIWTAGHGIPLTSGDWSPARYSVFYLTKMDGTLDIWDIINRQDSPVISVKITDQPLTCIRPHEQGHLVAVGSSNGCVYMMEFSENLITNHKNDKGLLTALLDRESRREKVIESKNRELRLKMKSTRQESVEGGEDHDAGKALGDLKDPLVVQYEREYFATIEAELARQNAIAAEDMGNE